MNKTHLRTYANHIRSALLTHREALKYELAVMFAVTLECDGNKRLSREAIYQVYNSTGSYKCAAPSERDWKAVGRRITGGLALYDFLGAEQIAEWTQGERHGQIIQALLPHIEALKLGTINEVLTVCEKVKPPRSASVRNAPPGSHVVNTEHCHIVIPPTVSAAEVMTIINNLMEYANTLLDAGKLRPQRKAA